MFRKVLIANRGAIACRIIRTLRNMGIGSVAVYSEADRHSLHVQQADEALLIGPPPATQSYLSVGAILEAARKSGAEAIHPGYGFLSENADFAQVCADSGVVFIGPTPEQMRVFGLKHTARAMARECGIPLLPGTGLLAGVQEAVEAAEQIGYPVMLKSTAGGGGIGMRLCRSPEELAEYYEAVESLSRSSFGSSELFLEKFVVSARHIEVQIFGDGSGTVIALGERDCSPQRRNQKVIEETPAPGIRQSLREKMFAAAVGLGKAVGYQSAGTVEFIYDNKTEEFYFLEVNTRLQVEHGVTEQVTGIDLVEWMVQQAAGELPDLSQARIRPAGCSIQVRVYAENPAKNFQPSSGKLSHVEWPSQARVETWVEAGTEVTPFYDPMLAKIIVDGADRAAALAHLHCALQRCTIAGIETNLSYLRQVTADPGFEAGGITTSFLEAFEYQRSAIDVIEPGTQTTVQDYPGRSGYWHVGVPPSGPMDALAFRIANRLVGNLDSVAGLEIAVTGPTLQFRERRCNRFDRRGFRRAAGWHTGSAVAIHSGFGGLYAGDDDIARSGEPRVSGDFRRRGCAGVFGKPQHFYSGRFWRTRGACAARWRRDRDHRGWAALRLHTESACRIDPAILEGMGDRGAVRASWRSRFFHA